MLTMSSPAQLTIVAGTDAAPGTAGNCPAAASGWVGVDFNCASLWTGPAGPVAGMAARASGFEALAGGGVAEAGDRHHVVGRGESGSDGAANLAGRARDEDSFASQSLHRCET